MANVSIHERVCVPYLLTRHLDLLLRLHPEPHPSLQPLHYRLRHRWHPVLHLRCAFFQGSVPLSVENQASPFLQFTPLSRLVSLSILLILFLIPPKLSCHKSRISTSLSSPPIFLLSLPTFLPNLLVLLKTRLQPNFQRVQYRDGPWAYGLLPLREVKGAKQTNICPSLANRGGITHRVRIQKDERRCTVVRYVLLLYCFCVGAHHFIYPISEKWVY